MQHQTDDMDDLFRKAAKDYPFKAEGADWSKVQEKLQQSEGEPGTEKKRRRRVMVLWVLLPLLMAATAYVLYYTLRNDEKAATQPRQKTITNESDVVRKNSADKNNEIMPEDLQAPPGIELRQEQQLKKAMRVQQLLAEIRKRMNPAMEEITDDKINTVSEPTFLLSERVSADPLTFIPGQISPRSVQGAEPHDVIDRQNINFNMQNYELKKEKKFYVGVISGIDATTVKFQRLERMSHDFGVLLGYNFMKNWSVEAGVFSARKYYYTEGEYFSKKNIYLPPNTKLLEVEGNCRMLEFPVTVKYNFNNKKKLQPFATAGITSYMMKSENYGYLYQYASGSTREVYKDYKNSSDHLAATVNFSAGYSVPVGKVADLRVEPYVSLPLKGVGIGSLPFTSAGIRVGVTKKLF